MISLADALLHWYECHQRDLPWRHYRDPYAIWVAEVMLQQTRVAQVIPYFQRWLDRFPNIASLAQASRTEVLQVWEGMGYYQRAHHLHEAAQTVQTCYGGHLPQDMSSLLSLPGIGRYTAAAIASIGFGQATPALDSNVRRILSRLFAIASPGEGMLWELANSVLPQGSAGDFNQALMDLGALLCTPRQPQCTLCPLSSFCQAWQRGDPEAFPAKKNRPTIPHSYRSGAILQWQTKVAIVQAADKLLQGLWEFPHCSQDIDLLTYIATQYDISMAQGERLGKYRHAYTHFRVTITVWFCRVLQQPSLSNSSKELLWIERSSLAEYPMGKLARRIALQVANHSPDR